MITETVTVIAGGSRYSKWESVLITAGAEQAARSFTINAAEPRQDFADAWAFAPGTPVEVYAGGDLLVDGYVDSYEPKFDATSHGVTITGRSKAKDAIDSSAVHATGEFRNQNLKGIAGQLDQFGIGFSSNVQLDQIPLHRLVPGATVFQELEVLARSQALLMIGEPDGSVMITRAGQSGRHAGALLEGVNILRASAMLGEQKKHSHVHARGQRSIGTGKQAMRIEHVATDTTVKRYRPLVVIAEGDTDMTRVKKRADWQVSRAAGWGTTAEVTLLGWRDSNGVIWDPKKLIYLESKMLKIAQDMAIKTVKFEQDDKNGTVATLSLVDPRALGGSDVKGKSNSAWATSEVD